MNGPELDKVYLHRPRVMVAVFLVRLTRAGRGRAPAVRRRKSWAFEREQIRIRRVVCLAGALLVIQMATSCRLRPIQQSFSSRMNSSGESGWGSRKETDRKSV